MENPNATAGDASTTPNTSAAWDYVVSKGQGAIATADPQMKAAIQKLSPADITAAQNAYVARGAKTPAAAASGKDAVSAVLSAIKGGGQQFNATLPPGQAQPNAYAQQPPVQAAASPGGNILSSMMANYRGSQALADLTKPSGQQFYPSEPSKQVGGSLYGQPAAATPAKGPASPMKTTAMAPVTSSAATSTTAAPDPQPALDFLKQNAKPGAVDWISGLMDVAGTGLSAWGHNNRKTRLQEQYAMQLASQQAANQAASDVWAKINMLPAETQAQIKIALANNDSKRLNDILESQGTVGADIQRIMASALIRTPSSGAIPGANAEQYGRMIAQGNK
jgi:hypothetical protein